MQKWFFLLTFIKVNYYNYKDMGKIIDLIKTTFANIQLLVVSLKNKTTKTDKQNNNLMEIFHEYIMKYEIIIKVIGAILAGITFWFTYHNYSDRLFNKYSINESETTITTPNFTLNDGTKCFTGVDMVFTIINKTDTLTIIKDKPQIFIRIYHNHSKFYIRQDIEVTKYIDSKIEKQYPLKIEKRLNREYFTYKLRNEFFNWVKQEIDNDDILKITIYLTFYNDVNKKTMQTKPIILNKEIYNSKTQWNFNIEVLKILNLKTRNRKPTTNTVLMKVGHRTLWTV